MNFLMDMNVQKLRNNYNKTDRTTSQPTAQVECWIMATEEQKVSLKTVLTLTLYFLHFQNLMRIFIHHY